MIRTPIVTALNTSTYTAIVVPFRGEPFPVCYFTENETPFYEATSAAGEGEHLVPFGIKVFEEQVVVDKTTRILLYAKAATGTPNLVVKTGKATGLRGR